MLWGERRQNPPFFAFDLVLTTMFSRQDFEFRGGKEMGKVAKKPLEAFFYA
jgi:hypothetical protein